MQKYLLMCFALNVFLTFGASLSHIPDSKIKEAIEELKKTGCTKTATDDQLPEFAKCHADNNKFTSAEQFAACKKFIDDKFIDKPILEAVCKSLGSSNDEAFARCILEERQKDYPQDEVVQATIDSFKKCQLTK